jgi:hypothetical protein
MIPKYHILIVVFLALPASIYLGLNVENEAVQSGQISCFTGAKYGNSRNFVDNYVIRAVDTNTSSALPGLMPDVKITDDEGLYPKGPSPYPPVIAFDYTTGRLYAAWSDTRDYIPDTNANQEIYFATSLDNGNTWSANIRVTNTPDHYEKEVDIAIGQYGEIYLTWVEGSEGGVFFARSFDGESWTNTQVRSLEFNKYYSGNSPSLAVDENGRIYIFWVDERETVPGIESPVHDIYWVFSEDGGNTFSTDTKVDIPLRWLQSPDVVVHGGVIYLMFFSFDGSFVNYLTKSTDSGETYSFPIRIDPTNNNTQYHPVMEIDEHGTIYTAWNTSDRRIAFSKSTDGGETFDPSMFLSDEIFAGDETIPDISVGLDGIIHVTWSTRILGLYTMLYSFSENAGVSFQTIGRTYMPVETYGVYSSSVTVDANGRPHLIWAEYQDGIYGVYTTTTDSFTCRLTNIPIYLQGWPTTPDYILGDRPWFDDPYGNYSYDDTRNTMGLLGCNTTSNAMLINYFAEQIKSPFRTDPGVLNEWLRNNGGYTANHGVIYGVVKQYAQASDVYFTMTGTIEGSNQDQRLRDHICAGNPAMLKVEFNPNNDLLGDHFVVVTGTTIVNGIETFTINDPATGSTNLLDGYGMYYGVNYYFGAQRAPSEGSIQISIYSPVHLLVTDPLGRTTGYDPRTELSWSEIPLSGYGNDTIGGPDGSVLPETYVLFIPKAVEGKYQVQVIGYDIGDYTLEVSKTFFASNRVEQVFFHGKAQTGSVDEWTINYYPPVYLYLPLTIK